MRNDLLFDWLIWVASPTVLVCWLNITFPLWSKFPPIFLILLLLLVIVALASALKLVLPTDSPWYIWLYRGVQVATGLLLALWRLAA